MCVYKGIYNYLSDKKLNLVEIGATYKVGIRNAVTENGNAWMVSYIFIQLNIVGIIYNNIIRYQDKIIK